MEQEDKLWREYLADMLCLNVRPKYDGDLTLYSELIRKKPKKEETAHEVKARILARLQG